MASTENGGRLILLTGATGYVGGRLLQALEEAGRHVRCLVRRADALGHRAATTETVTGDVLDAGSLTSTLRGVHTAYYLIHSMGRGADFEQADRRAAANFAAAARDARVRHIIYLGGLAHGPQRSAHLASRLEVGRILRESGIPATEFRTSIIIGPGSFSFEMIRALVERLPVMITPQWVRMRAQPIAIRDVIAYLGAALDEPPESSRVYEIGGGDTASYGELMRQYARLRRLRRLMIPVPVLTPQLSSLWLGLVTPLFARIGRQLIEGVRSETVVRDDTARHAFLVQPMSVREAMRTALADEDRACSVLRGEPPHDCLGRRFDSRTAHVPCPPAQAFAPIRLIGGTRGWYYANWLWSFRALLDRLIGGPGMRKGRRDPDSVQINDVIDCWRVEAYEPHRLLRLRTEMRLPGRGWLQFEVEGDRESSMIRQTAIFDPHGVIGRLYWHATLPLHHLIFRGMLRSIARRAERQAAPG